MPNASLYFINTDLREAEAQSFTTDSLGAWEVPYLAPGTYEAVVVADQLVTNVVSVEASGEGSDHIIELASSGLTVSGVVMLDGVGLANAVVRVSVSGIVLGETRTDDNGFYLIDQLPSGEFELAVRAPGTKISDLAIELVDSVQRDIVLDACDECVVRVGPPTGPLSNSGTEALARSA